MKKLSLTVRKRNQNHYVSYQLNNLDFKMRPGLFDSYRNCVKALRRGDQRSACYFISIKLLIKVYILTSFINYQFRHRQSVFFFWGKSSLNALKSEYPLLRFHRDRYQLLHYSHSLQGIFHAIQLFTRTTLRSSSSAREINPLLKHQRKTQKFV